MNESENKLNKLIVQRIQELRKKQGLSQDELSIKSGLEIKYVNKIENFKIVITIVTLDKIIQALNVDYDSFFSLNVDEELLNEPYKMISSLQGQLEKMGKELNSLKKYI
ncbi:helix-turn-helix domain-containing protein [Lentilactobacillus buchneri]|uniref:helix-turn-helix domain-containing protein n=1 Tax=Lentilactobacillus buchneri TaxID=1581 RepID=UPI0021A6BDCF|nr:helix-turn-helix transcriptional regulator [Lentilactobacillus buchneri]